jgi:hypothetical protein
MIRLILSSFLLVLVSFAFSVSANEICTAASTDNLTCPQFTINLQNIDPVNMNSSVPTGVQAGTSLLKKIADTLLFVIPLIAAISLLIAGYYYILSS